MSVVGTFDRLAQAPIGLLDGVRNRWLKLLGPLGRVLVRDRELRVGLGGALSITVALCLALSFPLVLLAVSPLLLGIPHVGSDLRYLLFRPGLHKRWLFLVPLALCLALLAYYVDPRFGFAPVVIAGVVARGASLLRRAVPIILGLGLILVGSMWPHELALLFAHAHNFVALGLFFAWRERKSHWHWLPVAVFAIGCAAILFGLGETTLAATRGLEISADTTDLYWQLAVYAPGAGMIWGTRLVLLFAFAQAMHYGVWLRLLPEEDRARATPRTFSASFAALREDWGRTGTILVGLVTVVLAVWAVHDLYAARMGYLRLVLFHGYFELAAVVLLWTEGRPFRSVDAPSSVASTSWKSPAPRATEHALPR
jgi:hypothetical protein